MFHTWHAGADCVHPAVYNAVRALATKRGLAGQSDAVKRKSRPWFDAEESRRGEECGQALNKARSTTSSMRDRLLPELHRVAQERLRDRQGPLPFF